MHRPDMNRPRNLSHTTAHLIFSTSAKTTTSLFVSLLLRVFSGLVYSKPLTHQKTMFVPKMSIDKSKCPSRQPILCAGAGGVSWFCWFGLFFSGGSVVVGRDGIWGSFLLFTAPRAWVYPSQKNKNKNHRPRGQAFGGLGRRGVTRNPGARGLGPGCLNARWLTATKQSSFPASAPG